MIEIRILRRDDAAVLDRVADDVFDHGVVPACRDEFLADPRHHLAVAIQDGVVVGMATAVNYVNPDKPPELWLNEVGVAAEARRAGVASRLLAPLLERGRELGCKQAWVLASPNDTGARRLDESTGGRAADELAVRYEFELGLPLSPLTRTP